MPERPNGPGPNGPPANGERLESWKEIAAYLKRGVRTIQRWERTEGLPVHRHLHEKRGTVYAYKSEIDAWWEKGRARLEHEPAPRPWVGYRAGGAAAAVVLLFAAVIAWWAARRPVIAFEPRSWVLIAQFENRTGEATFDGTLEYALERDLSNSRYVNVAPRDRIADTLRLMRRAEDTKLDAVLGREVCLRDGGIRALITGRMEKLNGTYVLSAAVMDPVTGATVATFSEEALGQNEAVPAVRKLSSRIRESLGEQMAPIGEGERSLERVTTPSLRALRLFTQADEAMASGPGGSRVAEALLRDAIAEDPEFASAHMLLASAIFRQLRPPAEYQPVAKRAFELAPRTSERERYFIEGSYYYLLGEQEKAIDAWTIQVKLYPDHFGAINQLAEAHHQLYRPAQATAYAMRRAQLRPNDFLANVRVADFLIRLGRVSEAKPYLKRAEGLDLTQAMERYPARVVWLQLIPAREAIAAGDLQRAVTQLHRFDGAPWPAQGGMYYQLALCYLDLGMLREAERWVQRIDLASLRHGLLARSAAARNDEAAVRHHLRLQVESSSHYSAMDVQLLMQAGMVTEARRAVELMAARPSLPQANFYPPAKAQVSLARAHVRRPSSPAEAAELLQESLREASPNEEWIRLEASYWLANLLDEQGDTAGAIRVLQPTSSLRPSFLFLNNLGFHWLRSQARLAILYRKAGREADAQAIEKDLGNRLAYADADHAILSGLRATAMAASPPAGR